MQVSYLNLIRHSDSDEEIGQPSQGRYVKRFQNASNSPAADAILWAGQKGPLST